MDVGRDFIITSEGNLYLTGPGRMQFAEFSPAEFVLAAKGGMFGLTVLEEDEAASWRREKTTRSAGSSDAGEELPAISWRGRPLHAREIVRE